MPKEHSALSWACRGAGGGPVEEQLPDVRVQYCGS
jgi:hypothetical protein